MMEMSENETYDFLVFDALVSDWWILGTDQQVCTWWLKKKSKVKYIQFTLVGASEDSMP